MKTLISLSYNYASLVSSRETVLSHFLLKFWKASDGWLGGVEEGVDGPNDSPDNTDADEGEIEQFGTRL